MPIYEYECREDGEVIELLRSMRDADLPVEDPKGRGRMFVRKHSVFGVAGGTPGVGVGGGGHVHSGPCCPCGKPSNQCGAG
ncbi:MAG: zinc ribbon domain-containing protein [Phycisphaerae bacterium]|nr:zinc ribbon domain-containing protein [Phycisphaerae bacterium]